MKIVFKKMNGKVGEYCQGVVRIDLTKDSNPAMTAIHEVIHHLYPKMSEKKTQYWEKRIWKNLKYKDRIKVYEQLLDKRANFIISLVKETIG